MITFFDDGRGSFSCDACNQPRPVQDRTMPTAMIGNMHKKLVEIGRLVPEICSWADRQTDSSQCSAAIQEVD